MKSEKNEIYIFCPKKGNPRKHIDVCRQCRYLKKCKAYQRYLQPELPFIFRSENLKMKVTGDDLTIFKNRIYLT